MSATNVAVNQRDRLDRAEHDRDAGDVDRGERRQERQDVGHGRRQIRHLDDRAAADELRRRQRAAGDGEIGIERTGQGEGRGVADDRPGEAPDHRSAAERERRLCRRDIEDVAALGRDGARRDRRDESAANESVHEVP
jgi:hypothetical protein